MIKTIAGHLRRKTPPTRPAPTETPIGLESEVDALREAGLSETLVVQIASGGPDTGIPIARAIRSGGPNLIASLNAAATAITERDLGYADAIADAMTAMRGLGIEVRAPFDGADLVRFVHAQGWLACEARLASPDMADAIADALNHPGNVTEKTPTDTINSWTVRALQQTVIGEASSR